VTSFQPLLPSQRLDGHHAVVTGAGRGIGRAAALALAEAGATLTLFARTADELETVADEVRDRASHADTCTGDVRSPEDVNRLMDVASAHEDLSICVTAAGINRPGPTLEQALEDFDLVVDTNLRGTYLACRAFAKAVVARRRGAKGQGARIVAISSQMGEVGYPGRAAYCASKHAVNGLVRALAVEWADIEIAVNAVAPTFVDTPLTRPMFEDEAFKEDVLRRLPIGRIGTPGDIVGAVVFLASEQASLVTGHILAVDGGWTAW
jgi:NAD(P)-dependent dehydrogenase (short-subunit alcohol dehydrogenase family)